MGSLKFQTLNSQDIKLILFKNKNMNKFNIHDRINLRMSTLMLKSRHLVDATGASKGTVSQWVNGGSEPSAKYIPALARVLKVSENWLLEGGPQVEQNPEMGDSMQVKIREIPLITLKQAVSWHLMMLEPFDEAIKWIEVLELVSPYAFAVKMENNSMMDLSGQGLSIPIGATLITDIGRQVKSGNVVVASIGDHEEAVIKRYVTDGPNRYLMSINQDYSKIQMNDECHIIGVCVNMQMGLY
ncbi:S24 family peptidase [Yersinia intermedia]|uniref:S24 family peptidase n=1 Tax=Yersinia intermedia TaxID=631 RepID=UPI0005EA4342|nr:S24 family peptidase [Yersinia intermedia]CNE47574.1 prophage repressor protein [Yersinia intermedia]